MKAVGVYDQIKTAFQDIVGPELHAIRGDIRVLDQRIVGVDEKISGVDARLGATTVSSHGSILCVTKSSPKSGGSTPGSMASIVSCAPRSTFESGWRRSRPAARPDVARQFLFASPGIVKFFWSSSVTSAF